MPGFLEINGTATELPTGFDISWDSGAGFNKYETYQVLLNIPSANLADTQNVRISYLGEKNGASLSTQVILDGITADGKEIAGSRIRLSSERPEMVFKVVAHKSLSINLLTNNSSGIVRIEVNGSAFERDLYIANVEAKSKTFDFWILNSKNQFTIKVALPRYQIQDLALIKRNDEISIQLKSVSLIVAGSHHVLFVDQTQKLIKTVFTGISGYQKRYFGWSRFVQQLLFALITTWLASALIRLYLRCGGIHKIFTGQARIFVILFCGAFICYLFWLLVFWPGVMSVDSLKIWRAAQLPEVFLNDHPILNVFLYTYLFHVWNNPAIVPLFHITVMSALVSTLFFTIFKQKVSLKLLIPFYLYTVLSIPIGLYNTVLWKDIPFFAMLVVYWAFISAIFYLKKKSGSLSLSIEQVIALILLLFSLGFIRHNGFIYIIFIPFLYLVLGLIRLNRNVWLVLFGLTLMSIFTILFIANSSVADAGFLIKQAKAYLQAFFQSSPTEIIHRTWANYWGVLNINQNATKWDLFNFYLNDRYNYEFLKHARWQDVYPYLNQWNGPLALLKDHSLQVYQVSYMMPFVYLSWNPVWALALFPLCIMAFRWLPLSAVFSSVILAQVFTLTTLLNILNWRYYYFVCLASCFIIPMICFDFKINSSRRLGE